jgi:hypothetical protein
MPSLCALLNSSFTSIIFNNYVFSSYFCLCSFLFIFFLLIIHYSFSIALYTFILLWTPKLQKCVQLLATNIICFLRLLHFFSSLNIPLVTFSFYLLVIF